MSWGAEIFRQCSPLHVSCVTCHVSSVTCHVFFLLFFSGQISGASYWRVCNQQSLPRLFLRDKGSRKKKSYNAKPGKKVIGRRNYQKVRATLQHKTFIWETIKQRNNNTKLTTTREDKGTHEHCQKVDQTIHNAFYPPSLFCWPYGVKFTWINPPPPDYKMSKHFFKVRRLPTAMHFFFFLFIYWDINILYANPVQQSELFTCQFIKHVLLMM